MRCVIEGDRREATDGYILLVFLLLSFLLFFIALLQTEGYIILYMNAMFVHGKCWCNLAYAHVHEVDLFTGLFIYMNESAATKIVLSFFTLACMCFRWILFYVYLFLVVLSVFFLLIMVSILDLPPEILNLIQLNPIDTANLRATCRYLYSNVLDKSAVIKKILEDVSQIAKKHNRRVGKTFFVAMFMELYRERIGNDINACCFYSNNFK